MVFIKKSGSLSELGFSLIESPSNRIIVKLVKLLRKAGRPRPQNIESKSLNIRTNNLILMCHASPVIGSDDKYKFLSSNLNNYKWWNNNLPIGRDIRIYLFCCYGYVAFYCQVMFLLEDRNVEIISYFNRIKIGFGHKEIENLISIFFYNVRKDEKNINSSDYFTDKIVKEKKQMENKLIRLRNDVVELKNKKELAIYDFQLYLGFQSDYDFGIN